jgi:hypothetical protein
MSQSRTYIYTVKPIYNGHMREPENVTLMSDSVVLGEKIIWNISFKDGCEVSEVLSEINLTVLLQNTDHLQQA